METNKQLCAAAYLGATIGTLYTVPASTTSIVSCIRLANVTTSSATFTLHVVPNTGSASAANAALGYAVQMAANSTYSDISPLTITAGCTIQGLSGTASAIVIHISGVEIT